MQKVFSVLAFISMAMSPYLTMSQRIVYSEPEKDDGRRTNFDIIGKIGGNVLVFKNNRSDNAISVYNSDMKLLERVNLSFMPDRYTDVYFIPYADFCYMLYEYQHKNIVHLAMVKIDGMGKKMADPIDLDTTHFGGSANKIYTTIFSEDRQRIIIVKINSKNPKNFLFTTFLYNAQFELLDQHRIWLPMEERNDFFTDFVLDNDGNLVFAKFLKSSSNDYISRVSFVSKGATADSFVVKDAGTGDHILDEIKVRADNLNKQYILTGFYYKQRRGNIEGIYTVIWDRATNSKQKESLTIFNDELRTIAKSSEENQKMAFNDFFIKQVIPKKDGGFILLSESEYTTSRGGYFNRWDYMYGSPYYSPLDYYGGPYYNPYRYGYPSNGYNNAVRYHAENIMMLSFDKDVNLEWSNVIPKSQFDDESENVISYQIMNTGGELHFMYNEYDRRNILLTDQSISPDGKITRHPTLRNLDRGFEFLPRHGKQIGATQIIFPCLYRNYLCFAKVEF
ncbi:MAG TPA: hypothetical protein VKR32_02335 [Puia sp.]|nr:hypothetical protein [Puia sp.]